MNTTRSLILFLALALFGLVLLAFPIPTARAADPVIVRVTTAGTTTWPCGASWANPCALQTALTNTVSGSELWVAAGTYTPTTGTDRFSSFQLRDGVALYGGFAGGETLRSQRHYTANVTILSGDIGIPGDSRDNAYNVVMAISVTNTAVLDGFTVTHGNANYQEIPPPDRGRKSTIGGTPRLATVASGSMSPSNGGGMLNLTSNPALANVTFSGNSAINNGGGMFNGASNPTLTNVAFISNTADYQGGGMANISSNPTLSNVALSGNTAGNSGGAMYNYHSSPTLTNVAFTSNWAAPSGGGMSNWYTSTPTLLNVTFSGNSAGSGGGMDNNDGSSPSLTNVTFSGNSARGYGGGGMSNDINSSPTLTNVSFSGNSAVTYGAGIANYRSSSPAIRNTIVWGNPTGGNLQIYNDRSTPNISYSVVQGGCPLGSTCTHIVTANPRLGPLDYWGGSTQTIPLLPGSSAVDAGNDAVCPPTDQRGVPRPQGAHCDIGAFEGVLNLPELDLPLISR